MLLLHRLGKGIFLLLQIRSPQWLINLNCDNVNVKISNTLHSHHYADRMQTRVGLNVITNNLTQTFSFDYVEMLHKIFCTLKPRNAWITPCSLCTRWSWQSPIAWDSWRTICSITWNTFLTIWARWTWSTIFTINGGSSFTFLTRITSFASEACWYDIKRFFFSKTVEY